MICPTCKRADHYVLETRKQTDAVWRRRACNICGRVFHTREEIVGELPNNFWKKKNAKVPDSA